MASKDFIPQNDTDLRMWATNYKTQLQNNSTNVGVDAYTLNTIIAAVDELVNAIDDVKTKEDAYRGAVRHKETMKDTQIALLRRQIASVKTHPNYTDSLGAVLGVVGIPTPPPDWDNMKPMPKVKKTAAGVEISYVRKNTDGVLVYSKRGNEAEFTRIDRDIRSPFIDKRANLNGATSESRQYYLVYFKGDDLVGQESDIVTVVV